MAIQKVLSLPRRILKLAVPAVTENLFNSLVFLIDALMVAALGPTALAAVGLATVPLWRLRMNLGVLQFSFGAAIARRWGEGNISEARRLLSHGMVLGFVSGLLCYPLIPLARPLFELLNASGDLLNQAVPYFQMTLICWPLRMANLNLATALRAAGDTRTPMVTTLVMNITNAGMNYLLIFGHFGFPKLGLFGAAVATCLAVVLEFAMLGAVCYYGLKLPRYKTSHLKEAKHHAVFRFSPKGIRLYRGASTRRLLRIAIPTFWEEIAITAGYLTFFALIAGLGEEALAAQTACLRIESFSFNVGHGIALAAATLVGQAIGAGLIDEAKRVFAMCITLSFAVMGAMGMFFALYPDLFLQWFVPEGDRTFLALARLAFVITAIEQPFIGACSVLSAGLRSAGDTRSPFISQLVSNFFVRITVGYLLAYPLGMGLEGLIWGTVADWVVRFYILIRVMIKGKWTSIRL